MRVSTETGGRDDQRGLVWIEYPDELGRLGDRCPALHLAPHRASFARNVENLQPRRRSIRRSRRRGTALNDAYRHMQRDPAWPLPTSQGSDARAPTLARLARPTVDLKSIATHPPLQAATTEC